MINKHYKLVIIHVIGACVVIATLSRGAWAKRKRGIYLFDPLNGCAQFFRKGLFMNVCLVDTGLMCNGLKVVEDEMTMNWYLVDPELLASFADVSWGEPFIPTAGCMYIDLLPFEGNA